MIHGPRNTPRERAAAAVRYRAGAPSGARTKPKLDPTVVRRRIVWLLGAAFLLECCLFLTRSPWLVVLRVHIVGASSLTPGEAAEAREAASVPPNTNLITAKVGPLEARLKRLPFVARAEVRRRAPSSLEVRITPRRPVATLVAPAESWEIDRAGVVIRARRTGVLLPEIECEEAQNLAPGADSGTTIESALVAATYRGFPSRAAVGKIRVDRQANLCLNMVDGIVIRMGQADQLKDKLGLVQRIYQEDPDIAAKVQSIDVSCPEAPACTPRAVGTDSPQNSDPQRPAPERRPSRSVSRASQPASSGTTSMVKR